MGPNNIGKSTICEAIDLVLGPDRLSRFPPIEEFDFYNAQYLKCSEVEGEDPEPLPLRIEVVLTGLNDEVESRCGQHLEFWSAEELRCLSPGEIASANPPLPEKCLRLETVGIYNRGEDEFEAQTYYSHSPTAEPGELDKVGKPVKRLFGFLYLRTLRAGSRALSLENANMHVLLW